MRTVASSCSSFFSHFLDLLYPRKCPLCGLLADEVPCETCVGEMILAEPAISERNDVLSFRAALYDYEGRAGQAVRQLKYARSTSLAPFMAGKIAEAACQYKVDAIIPVPIHWRRRHMRGFNQSELLCSKVRSSPELLRRVRATKPQVGLSRQQREKNLEGAFQASCECRGLSILLVDDVVTSGQTARACAQELIRAGATEVGILAFCGDLTS